MLNCSVKVTNVPLQSYRTVFWNVCNCSTVNVWAHTAYSRIKSSRSYSVKMWFMLTWKYNKINDWYTIKLWESAAFVPAIKNCISRRLIKKKYLLGLHFSQDRHKYSINPAKYSMYQLTEYFQLDWKHMAWDGWRQGAQPKVVSLVAFLLWLVA
jgi:hypothetical protein